MSDCSSEEEEEQDELKELEAFVHANAFSSYDTLAAAVHTTKLGGLERWEYDSCQRIYASSFHSETCKAVGGELHHGVGWHACRSSIMCLSTSRLWLLQLGSGA